MHTARTKGTGASTARIPPKWTARFFSTLPLPDIVRAQNKPGDTARGPQRGPTGTQRWGPYRGHSVVGP